jgi:hypothetical protein
MVGRLMNIRRRLTTKVMLTGTAVVRNRMPGGVGGRREQSRLLPDLMTDPYLVWDAVLHVPSLTIVEVVATSTGDMTAVHLAR